MVPLLSIEPYWIDCQRALNNLWGQIFIVSYSAVNTVWVFIFVIPEGVTTIITGIVCDRCVHIAHVIWIIIWVILLPLHWNCYNIIWTVNNVIIGCFVCIHFCVHIIIVWIGSIHVHVCILIVWIVSICIHFHLLIVWIGILSFDVSCQKACSLTIHLWI